MFILDPAFIAFEHKFIATFDCMEIVEHELWIQSEVNQRTINNLIRKIDVRLMPLLTLLFFFSFLNRINIGDINNSNWSYPC